MIPLNFNRASSWRLSTALSIAGRYSTHQNVGVVMIVGSTSRGHADAFSDVEILVVWNGLPDTGFRRTAGGASLVRAHEQADADGVWLDELSGDVDVEVNHLTAESVERTVRSLTVDFAPNLNDLALASSLSSGILIKDVGLLHNWRVALAIYPDALAAEVIRRYGALNFDGIEIACARRNALWVTSATVSVVEAILRMLFAINRVYDPGFKWLAISVGRLSVLPRDLVARVEMSFETPLADRIDDLRALALETLELAAGSINGVDVAFLTKLAGRSARRWESPQ